MEFQFERERDRVVGITVIHKPFEVITVLITTSDVHRFELHTYVLNCEWTTYKIYTLKLSYTSSSRHLN